jgi:hypothetical protein
MFETPEERVKLLKAGIDSKTIEELYIFYNNFKIALFPILFEDGEIDIESNGLPMRPLKITLQNKIHLLIFRISLRDLVWSDFLNLFMDSSFSEVYQ